MLADKMLKGIAAQFVTPDRRKERIVSGPAALLEPTFQQARGVAAERRAAFLSALALAA